MAKKKPAVLAIHVSGRPKDLILAMATEVGATMFLMQTLASMAGEQGSAAALVCAMAAESIATLLEDALADETDASMLARQRKCGLLVRRRLAPFVTEVQEIDDPSEMWQALDERVAQIERAVSLAMERMALRRIDPEPVA